MAATIQLNGKLQRRVQEDDVRKDEIPAPITLAQGQKGSSTQPAPLERDVMSAWILRRSLMGDQMEKETR